MSTEATIYCFFDAQNLNKSVGRLSWKIDYRKLILYLEQRHMVSKTFVFMGLIPSNHLIYDQLRNFGYTIIFKPTIGYIDNGIRTYKGNVDVDLAVYAAAIEFGNYDKAIILSSDGDFLCLLRYLESKNKLHSLMVPGPNYSKLLEEFSGKIVRLYKLRDSLELR